MNTKNSDHLLKRINSKILIDKDIDFLVQQSKQLLPPGAISKNRHLDFNIETTIRLIFLSSKCSEQRKELGWDIAAAAKKVGVPNYRINSIESGYYNDFSQKEVRLYIKVLGIEDWFRRWIKLNNHIFASIAEEPNQSTPWAKRLRGTNT